MRRKLSKNNTLQINRDVPVRDGWSSMFTGHVSKDYPLTVLYCEPEGMFTGSQRLHWHKEYELDYVRSGSCIYHIGDSEIPLSEGSAILISGGRLHKVTSGDGATIISVMFDPDFIFGEGEENSGSMISLKYRNPLSELSFKYLVCEKDNKDIQIINDIIKTALDKKYGYELITKGLLCRFWMQALISSTDISEDKNAVNSYYDEMRTKLACDYINQNYKKALTLDEIAESIPVSKSECCRCFKRVSGMTPFEYLMLERVTRAAYLLQHPESYSGNMQELASLCGFNDASYFNKIFRKITGVTPSVFKDNIRKNHRDALSPLGIPM